MKFLYAIFAILLVACSSETVAKKDFIENKEKYNGLYKIIAKYRFEQITLDTVDDLQIADEGRIKFIRNTIKTLKIVKIEKFKEGIFFITGKSAIGDEGFFRSVVPKDSLKYFTILNHIDSDWYYWYQD